MKVNFGSFELGAVTIHFAYEGKNIWISVGSISDYIGGGPNMGASAAFLVSEAEKRDPTLTQEKAVKLPLITSSGKPTTEHYWYYRIDLDLKIFGIQAGKILMIETEIHKPLQDGLKDVLK